MSFLKKIEHSEQNLLIKCRKVFRECVSIKKTHVMHKCFVDHFALVYWQPAIRGASDRDRLICFRHRWTFRHKVAIGGNLTVRIFGGFSALNIRDRLFQGFQGNFVLFLPIFQSCTGTGRPIFFPSKSCPVYAFLPLSEGLNFDTATSLNLTSVFATSVASLAISWPDFSSLISAFI